MKLYTYINIEYAELSKLIHENSATRKDMYFPSDPIPIDHNDDDYFFYTIEESKSRIHLSLFRTWAHKCETTFYVFPAQQNSLIIGVPCILLIFSLLFFVFFAMAYAPPIFVPFPILLGLALIYRLSYQLDEVLNKLKIAFEKK